MLPSRVSVRGLPSQGMMGLHSPNPSSPTKAVSLTHGRMSCLMRSAYFQFIKPVHYEHHHCPPYCMINDVPRLQRNNEQTLHFA